MRSFVPVIVAGVLLGGTALVDRAEAGDKRHGRRSAEVRYEPYHAEHYRRGYFSDHDLVVIRDYYRPYYRPLPPGLRKRFYRTESLPPGWAKRMHPVPAYVERHLIAEPRGYHRGIIDGQLIVYSDRGFILDVAALF